MFILIGASTCSSVEAFSANFYNVKMFTLVHNKSLLPLPKRRTNQSDGAVQLLEVKVGELEGWKKEAERTTAPFSLRPVDMKDHIMSEIRGNYTGSAL